MAVLPANDDKTTQLTLASPSSSWSNKYTNIHYVKVDVDALPSLTQEYGVTAMPTFMVFKDGEKVDSLRGAMPQALLKIIENHNPAEETKTEE